MEKAYLARNMCIFTPYVPHITDENGGGIDGVLFLYHLINKQ